MQLEENVNNQPDTQLYVFNSSDDWESSDEKYIKRQGLATPCLKNI